MTAVTSDNCDKRHKRVWLAVKVGGGMLGLMLTLIGIFSTMVYRASAEANKAKTVADVVNAKHDSTLPFIRDGIVRIEQQLRDLRKDRHKGTHSGGGM